MTITDATIAAGDTIYLLTSAGLTLAGMATTSGTVTITFTSDPVFVVASTMRAQSPVSITSTTGHFGTVLHLTTSGGSGTGAISFSVVNGTSKGCVVTNSSLMSTMAGTCIVTATKAADSTYESASSSTVVVFALPPRPPRVTTTFTLGKSAVSASARATLRILARKLVGGASVTVTGFAKGNAALARSRALSVAKYLRTLVRVTVKIQVVTNSNANNVFVVTSKQ